MINQQTIDQLIELTKVQIANKELLRDEERIRFLIAERIVYKILDKLEIAYEE